MKRRITAFLAMLLVMALLPGFASAVNYGAKTFGVAEYNGVQMASILVAPNRTSITVALFATNLGANAAHTVDVLSNDVCAAVGASLTGPIGPVATNNIGQLNVAAQPSLNAPIDVPLPAVQNIAVRVYDNAGATVRCGRIYTNNPGGAGSHWW